MANGNFGGGTGVEDDPYLIEDAFDLDAVRNNLSACYKLVNHIDLNIPPFNEGKGWTPIGDSENRFNGKVYGNGQRIYNLFIDLPDRDYVGLFGHISGTSITSRLVEDLYLDNVNITGGSRTGGIVGHGALDINRCFVSGKIKGTGERLGGIAGNFVGIMNDSHVDVDIESGIYYSGLLIGYADGVGTKINRCLSQGSGTGDVRGLVGTSVSGLAYTSNFYLLSDGVQLDDIRSVSISIEQAKTAQTFVDAGWHEALNGNGETTWILNDGEIPQLWFQNTSTPYYLVKDGESIKTLKSSQWTTISTLEPTVEDFISHGFYSIGSLTSETLSKLDSNSPELLYYIEEEGDIPIVTVSYHTEIWTPVSSAMPSLQQFKDDGMIDLSVLDRKGRTQTQDMIDLGEYHNGKMYSAKIDLSKHFSIDELRVK